MTTLKHDYRVVYTPIEDGWIMATVPELPGAITQGRDMAEARTMIREAVELLLEAYAENVAVIAPRDEPNASQTLKFRGDASRVKRPAHHAER